MIETAQEFIDKLLNYFPKTDDITGELTDGIKQYIRRNNFNDVELERLYSIIQENCGSFPLVKIVAKLWKEHGQRFDKGISTDNSAISKYKHIDWKDVIEEIQSIRYAQDYRELKASEIDILNDYDDLYYVYKLLCEVSPLVMSEDEKATYLRKVKEDVDAKIPINLDRVRARMQLRYDEYNQKYGDQEREVSEKIVKTAQNIEDTFGNSFVNKTSKLTEPEPDKQVSFKY